MEKRGKEMKKIMRCIECGSVDIKIWDCGYSSFNVGGAKCNKCGNNIELKCCGCFPEEEIITSWNRSNPAYDEAIKRKRTSIEKHRKSIIKLEQKISELTEKEMKEKYE